ncbi:MAG: hypothetical protein MAGBODY4_01463 [Candidatus Marinimicrobia bacterium]|nr:hypothetical protein [Candidatus Neomarinimicrobiota bacterium]
MFEEIEERRGIKERIQEAIQVIQGNPWFASILYPEYGVCQDGRM